MTPPRKAGRPAPPVPAPVDPTVRIGRRVLVPWAAVRLLAQQGTV
jgi:hypothetical protein